MSHIFDTHCHVHFNAYKDDMDKVIQESLDQGVFMITVGTQIDTSRNGLKKAEQFDGLWASVGLHPNHLTQQEFFDNDELPEEEQTTPRIRTRAEIFDFDEYKSLGNHPKCVAIGECGFDYYRIPENADVEKVKSDQEEAVRQQFDLATELNLPVIVHCRDAHDDQIRVIREYVEAGKLKSGGVIHCFSGTLEEAETYIALGFHISVTGIVTFGPRKNEETFENGLTMTQFVAKHIPLDRLLIETDAPYLTPHPHRGERNHPGFVRHVGEKIAELRDISEEELFTVTTSNAKRLFQI